MHSNFTLDAIRIDLARDANRRTADESGIGREPDLEVVRTRIRRLLD